MQARFPIPRLTEPFIDEIVRRVGGRRFTEVYSPPSGMANPDYVFPGFLAEAKILEEEGLAKNARQAKLAKILSGSGEKFAQEDFYDAASPKLKRQIEDLLLEPIQGAIKKASKQFKAARALPLFGTFSTVLIAVNSGYSSLPPDLFKALVLRCCRQDTSQIDLSVCLSVHHHQGDFDSYVFFTKEAIHIHDQVSWDIEKRFIATADTCFEEAMTMMMCDQLNQDVWAQHLAPVEDILFEGDGISYVRRCLSVPDSRFS